MEQNQDKIEIDRLKKNLRKEIISKLRSQPLFIRNLRSWIIYKRLFSLAEFKSAKIVMFFVSFDAEVDTMRMILKAIKMGKRVVVPVIKNGLLIISELLTPEKELQKGRFGIFEPSVRYLRLIDPKQIDLVIVPGIAFDRNNNRLGRGKGYYDRFLSTLPVNIPKIGIAFKFQVVQNLPTQPHDVPVTHLIAS
jgi:5-formyltetrahydrofolate cyclo-ligase